MKSKTEELEQRVQELEIKITALEAALRQTVNFIGEIVKEMKKR